MWMNVEVGNLELCLRNILQEENLQDSCQHLIYQERDSNTGVMFCILKAPECWDKQLRFKRN